LKSFLYLYRLTWFVDSSLHPCAALQWVCGALLRVVEQQQGMHGKADCDWQFAFLPYMS
jgi:hypothetical protein